MRYAMLLLLLSGCAVQYGVNRLGEDRFEVSAMAAPAAGGAGGARSLALAEASKHCEKMGKRVDVERTENRYAFPANSVATVQFACH